MSGARDPITTSETTSPVERARQGVEDAEAGDSAATDAVEQARGADPSGVEAVDQEASDGPEGRGLSR